MLSAGQLTITTPGSSSRGVQRWWACAHTPSQATPLVGRHQLHPQGSSTYLRPLSLSRSHSVKYFNAEQYEADRYCGAVSSHQKYSVSVQYSLSLLNIAQQLLMQGTMCGAMVIMIYTSDDVGAFVAVQAYLIQLFTPLNFLGTSTRPTARSLTSAVI